MAGFSGYSLDSRVPDVKQTHLHPGFVFSGRLEGSGGQNVREVVMDSVALRWNSTLDDFRAGAIP